MHWDPLSDIVCGVIHKEMPFEEQPPHDPHKLAIQFRNSELEHGKAATQVDDSSEDVPQVLTSVGCALFRQQRWKHELIPHSPGWLTPHQFIQKVMTFAKGPSFFCNGIGVAPWLQHNVTSISVSSAPVSIIKASTSGDTCMKKRNPLGCHLPPSAAFPMCCRAHT